MNLIANAVRSSDYHVRDACPCCGAPVSRAQVSITSKRPAEHLSPDEHTQFVSGYSPNRVFFTYFRCGECSGLYCPIFYNNEQLRSFYGHQSENMSEVPLEARRRTQEGYAEALLAVRPEGGDYLEIGADIGLLAHKCAHGSRFNHIWLYEPNIDVRDELAQRLQARPNTVLEKMLPGEEVPHGTVSTAAMVHVLDHLLEPLEMLKTIYSKMSRGAALLIVTHNSSSLLARTLGRRWPPFTLQHPQIFNPASIKALLSRSGFSVAMTKAAVNYFPLSHLLQAGFAICGLSSSLLIPRLPVIPVRLGNMLIVARKS